MIATSLFREAFVDADGFRVRYLEAGSGAPLVHIHSAGGLRISRSREKLPDCNLVLLYDVAHEAAAERPEAFSSLVTDFLQRRSAFIVNQKSAQLYP